jgi:hypothetical protein
MICNRFLGIENDSALFIKSLEIINLFIILIKIKEYKRHARATDLSNSKKKSHHCGCIFQDSIKVLL